MISPYDIDGHKMAHRVDSATATRVIAAGRAWLCWPLCVVLEEMASEPNSLPLSGMPLGVFFAPMDESQTSEDIFRAVCAPTVNPDSTVARGVGIPWWARPLAEAGDGNEVVALGMSQHPLVRVVRNSRIIGLVAASRVRHRPGLPSGYPSHHIDGTPWGAGQDPTGQRFSTPFDRRSP